MAAGAKWTRQELLVAFALYCRLPFGRLHQRNPEIVRFAKAIGRTPAALAMKLVNIASLDSSITSTGRAGLRGAAAQDRQMWAEMESDWSSFAVAAQEALAMAEGEPAEPEARPAGSAQAREVLAVRKERVGQAFFRRALLGAYRGACCITGLAKPELLVASHIKPWRADAGNRANPRNGLLLSALHDKAFDAGLITVAVDMTVCVGADLAAADDEFLAASVAAYHGRPLRLPGKFQPDPALLAYHRECVFRG